MLVASFPTTTATEVTVAAAPGAIFHVLAVNIDTVKKRDEPADVICPATDVAPAPTWEATLPPADVISEATLAATDVTWEATLAATDVASEATLAATDVTSEATLAATEVACEAMEAPDIRYNNTIIGSISKVAYRQKLPRSRWM
jgi:hypothetical protein